jgi:hypothetical protein
MTIDQSTNMKSTAIVMLVIITGVCALALTGCQTSTTFDPVTGAKLNKTVVPDKDFTAALAATATAAAQQAIKTASDDYLATHLPKSAVAAPLPPPALP